MPVPELTFDEDGVYVEENGELLPLEEEQVEKSKLVKIGAYLSKELNPHLNCCFISDGSLLDTSSLQEVITWANDNDIQIIIECVSDEHDEAHIEFIEKAIS